MICTFDSYGLLLSDKFKVMQFARGFLNLHENLLIKCDIHTCAIVGSCSDRYILLDSVTSLCSVKQYIYRAVG